MKTITITNPWSEYKKEVTKKDVTARLKKMMPDTDYRQVVSSKEYKAEMRQGFSAKTGMISAYMHS